MAGYDKFEIIDEQVIAWQRDLISYSTYDVLYALWLRTFGGQQVTGTTIKRLKNILKFNLYNLQDLKMFEKSEKGVFKIPDDYAMIWDEKSNHVQVLLKSKKGRDFLFTHQDLYRAIDSVSLNLLTYEDIEMMPNNDTTKQRKKVNKAKAKQIKGLVTFAQPKVPNLNKWLKKFLQTGSIDYPDVDDLENIAL
jgi:hypothetical protein